MISILVVFYIFVFLFAIIGAMRGWAKEMLVVFSVVLALAFIAVMEQYMPVLKDFLTRDKKLQMWFRLGTVIVMVFFGYQSPKFARIAKSMDRRDRIQDLLLGLIMGAVSGYFIAGTVWSFIADAGYPFGDWVIPPNAQQPLYDATVRTIRYLPPAILGKPPTIFIAVVMAFVFVIVVFV